MITSTVHLYSKIVSKIDEYIVKNEYSTRADFILHAMRHTIGVYAQKKKLMVEKYLDGQSLSASQLDMLYTTFTEMYLNLYGEFMGGTIQVNVRIPDGLDNRLNLIRRNRYGFYKKSDYIKVSVMCLLADLNENERIFEDTESLVNEEQALLDRVFEDMILGLVNKKSGKDILTDAYNNLKTGPDGPE